MRCNSSNWAVYSPGSWDGFRNDVWALWAGVIMRLEHHLVGGYVRYISPYIIYYITCLTFPYIHDLWQFVFIQNFVLPWTFLSLLSPSFGLSSACLILFVLHSSDNNSPNDIQDGHCIRIFYWKIKLKYLYNTISGIFPGIVFHLDTSIRISKPLYYKGHQGQDRGRAIEAMASVKSQACFQWLSLSRTCCPVIK